jgi:acyl-CoA thioesterase I
MPIRYVTLKSKYKSRFIYTLRFFSSLWLALAIGVLTASAASDQYRLVALGDSLTAGYGLESSDSFPVQLQKLLKIKGYNVTVQNAGVSGDTTAGGLARLDWSLGEDVDGVIIELGANDALRGTSPGSTLTSLENIITRLKQRNIDVLLTGMLAPPNLGPDYGKSYNAIFPDLAIKYNLVFYPFFLKDVAAIPSLNQSDGIHPTAEGVRIITRNIFPKVEELLNNSDRYRRKKQ